MFCIDIAVNKVLETTDYDIFKLSNLNRVIANNEKLEKEIAHMGVLSPMIVNEEYLVIDGQHRLQSARKLQKPIPFIVIPGAGKREMISINTTSKNWSIRDYIESYHRDGHTEYTKLLELIKDRGLPNLGGVASIAMNSFNALQKVREGYFTFYNYDFFVQYLNDYERLTSKMLIGTRVNFLKSIYSFYRIEKFNINRLIDKSGLLSERLKGINDIGVTTQIVMDVYHHGLREGSSVELNYKFNVRGQIVFQEKLRKEFIKGGVEYDDQNS